MARPAKSRNRHPGGVIDTLPRGSLQVRVDGGIDPVTKRRHRPTVVIPAGPDAEKQAKAALVRLINEVNEHRHPNQRDGQPAPGSLSGTEQGRA